MKCPPCHGTCQQGRKCSASIEPDAETMVGFYARQAANIEDGERFDPLGPAKGLVWAVGAMLVVGCIACMAVFL